MIKVGGGGIVACQVLEVKRTMKKQKEAVTLFLGY